MLILEDKIIYFEISLNQKQENYADSFRSDIINFFAEFNSKNPLLQFLDKIESFGKIDDWISKLTSRIVMKFDEEQDQINDFIYDYLNNG